MNLNRITCNIKKRLMKNSLYEMAKQSIRKTGFIIVSIVFFCCGCSNEIKKSEKPAIENQKSIRQTEELSGNWKFQLDVRDIGEKERWFEKDHGEWSDVPVPLAWNCFEESLWQYEGIGWYTTTINPDESVAGKKTEIVFGRVMYYTKVWLNGEFIGENIGGYLPFRFDITKHLKQGLENKLVVRVDNRPRIEWLPAAEQIEWIQYGGILQPVSIVSTPSIYINDMTVMTIPESSGARIDCIVTVANETASEDEMEVEIIISRNSFKVSKSAKVPCKPGDTTKINVEFILEKADLWSPDTPALYSANVSLSKNGKKTDDLKDRFGIRQVSVEGTSILLNGKPILIKGTHRYDAYDRLGPNPPEKLLREELSLMKSVGINTIRVHYPASTELLNLYDEYGFMMLEEIP
jgi:beta-galactosidase/beta-glucuronidase